MAHNILIVDDSALTRAAIKRILGMVELDIGEVFEAENGAVALDMMDTHKVHLVLADLNMPEMGGVELVERMKAQADFADIPVIVVSTESSVTRIKELLATAVVLPAGLASDLQPQMALELGLWDPKVAATGAQRPQSPALDPPEDGV